jgi:hypothetical protein
VIALMSIHHLLLRLLPHHVLALHIVGCSS